MAGESIQKLRVGDEAPGFELQGTDGEVHTLSEYDHDAVLLVFTCNHCPYAQAKHPLLNDLAAEYDDVAVVGINSNDAKEYPDDSYEAMVEAMESGKIAFDDYLHDHDQSVAAAYGAVCTPDPFLLENDDGVYKVAYQGRLDDAHDPESQAEEVFVRDAIDAVLAGEPVDIEFAPSRGCTIKWKPGNEPEYWDDL